MMEAAFHCALHNTSQRVTVGASAREDFKPRVSQEAEIVGSCTEKKKRKRKGDLNSSKPAEEDKEGGKHCRHESHPDAFRRPGTANLSQEIKLRKGLR